jgi:hypothetical protein
MLCDECQAIAKWWGAEDTDGDWCEHMLALQED